jgi:hypothetical protein
MLYHLLWTIFTVLAILDLTSKTIDEHNWKLYLILAALYAVASRIDKSNKILDERLNFDNLRFIFELPKGEDKDDGGEK